MAEGSGDYINALRRTEEFTDPPIGLLHTDRVGTIGQDKEIMAQNNVIITLLIDLHNKLNRISAYLEKGTETPTTNDLQKIMEKIETLNFGGRKIPEIGSVKFARIKPPTTE